MFTPRELALERGWPGKIAGDSVIQFAAQTLEAFFTGGGLAREHNVYPLAGGGLIVLWAKKGWGSVRRIPGENRREEVIA